MGKSRGYVYRFKDADGNIVYVGKAKNIDSRMKTHFSGNGHLAKGKYRTVETVEYLTLPTYADAGVVELYLIGKWLPEYNVTNKSEDGVTVTIDLSDFIWKKYPIGALRTAMADKDVREQKVLPRKELRPMRIGYARNVGGGKRTWKEQLKSLEDAGCEYIYRDEDGSGGRPEMERLLTEVQEGDAVFAFDFFCLAPSFEELERIVAEFAKMDVRLVLTDTELDTSKYGNEVSYNILEAMFETRHNLISERTIEGLESAREKGSVGGRKPLPAKDVKKMLALYDSKEMSVAEVCEACGVSKTTLYRYVNERDGDGDDGS